MPRFTPLRSGPFATAHEAFVVDDAIDWTAASVETDDAARELGRRTFEHRALDEQRSLVAFSELLSALCRSGAPIDVIGSMTRVVRDEALHVDLCERMVERLGGWSETVAEPAWVALPAKWSLRQQVLATVLGSLCVGETISVALFRRARENATDPVAHQVLTRMLADESFHARFGWWWLESLPRTDAEQAFAERFVEHVLGSVVTDFLPTQTEQGLAKQGIPHVATPYGGIAADARRDAVLAAIETTVVPGFERACIAAKSIWERAQTREENA